MRLSSQLLAILFWVFLTPVSSAMAQSIDPGLEKDILKLMEVTGSAKLAEQMATFVAPVLLDGLRKSNPEIPQGAIDITKEVVLSNFKASMHAPNGLVSRMVPIYAKYFSKEEINGLLAFYGTELGRKSIEVMPNLMQEAMTVGKEWADETVPGIETELRARLKAEGYIK